MAEMPADITITPDRKSTRLNSVTPRSTLFPYTTLFRSLVIGQGKAEFGHHAHRLRAGAGAHHGRNAGRHHHHARSEEHTSELSHTEIYTLSLHDALPISRDRTREGRVWPSRSPPPGWGGRPSWPKCRPTSPSR